MRKYLTRLCKNIVSEKFNAQNYRTKKSYYGTDICVEPIVCGLYCNGFTLDVFAKQCYKIKYDYEFGGLWINDKPWKDYINLLYLEENDIRHSENPVWEDKPRSVELETYTNGGEDMIINLEEPTASQLQTYIDGFDIDENVSLWWENGRPGNGVPFDNMKEHYEDYENWLKELQKICDKMPF